MKKFIAFSICAIVLAISAGCSIILSLDTERSIDRRSSLWRFEENHGTYYDGSRKRKPRIIRFDAEALRNDWVGVKRVALFERISFDYERISNHLARFSIDFSYLYAIIQHEL